MNRFFIALTLSPFVLSNAPARAQESADRFQVMDVFKLEHASDPQISPDGKRVVYVRNFMDVKKDRRRSSLWIVNADLTDHYGLTSGGKNEHSPRWSPDGKRLLFVTSGESDWQIHCRWMDTGQSARLTSLPAEPQNLAWSPVGIQIAFTMQVVTTPEPLVKLPKKPEGAEWAEPFKVIRTVNYRFDGKGYLKDGFHHVFVLGCEGGAPRQLTKGDHEHRGPLSWAADARHLLVTANRHAEADYEPLNTEIYAVAVADGKTRALTNRKGPDAAAVNTFDGEHIAYTGFEDHRQGYQVTQLYLMGQDSPKSLTAALDRDVKSPIWRPFRKEIVFQYDDHGVTKIGKVGLDGKVQTLAEHLGGNTLDRPYASGSFSVANDGAIAFTLTGPDHPADVAVLAPGAKTPRRLTSLNNNWLWPKKLATVEEITFKSSHDGRKIQGWIVKPPDFDAAKKYPLILEIHGGPFANYGPRFAVDMQLYAAAGYVVFYANPRGSTGYGEEFGNLIHHAYPGFDYDDLMSGVDAMIANGYVDKEHLYVTGGSGGGVLSAWIIGKTNRFRAAVVCKPVINWYSFVLTADIYPFFARYWFPGPPWEHAEHYLKRSPLSLVGNVTTPTMLLTGESDHRTPMSESEQFYQALKLRKIDTVLVRVPGAPHDIAIRPSHMMAKAAHVLRWFEMHR